MSDPVTAARLTVVSQIYHQIDGEGPTCVAPTFARVLPKGGAEQPFGPRKLKVGEAWVPVPLGWLQGRKVALLVLEHRRPDPLAKQPTPEEKLAREIPVIEIGVALPLRAIGVAPLPQVLETSGEGVKEVAPVLLLGVGEGQYLRPADPARLVARCPSGGAYLVVTAFCED